MKDRIFPTLSQEGGLASEKEFTGINYEQLASNLTVKSVRTASKMPQGLEEILNNEIIDDNLRQAKKDEEPEETDTEETEEEVEGCGDGMKKQGRKRKVHFSSAAEISAEALEQAQASGSEELVNTILAARKQRRIHLANKIAKVEADMVRTAASKDAEIEHKIEQRDAYRKSLAAKIESGLTKTAQKSSKIKVSKSTDNTFKTVESMSSGQKRAFAAAAISNGFPKEYVESMLGENKEVVSAVETEIKEVMASSIPVNTKKAALQGMIKTAKLDGAQKQRLVDYWIKDLHYGDEEWVKNWINKNYD